MHGSASISPFTHLAGWSFLSSEYLTRFHVYYLQQEPGALPSLKYEYRMLLLFYIPLVICQCLSYHLYPEVLVANFLKCG